MNKIYTRIEVEEVISVLENTYPDVIAYGDFLRRRGVVTPASLEDEIADQFGWPAVHVYNQYLMYCYLRGDGE